MADKWQKLDNPPVVLAVMEIKFQLKSDIDISFLKKNDSKILTDYPKRTDNFTGNINLPVPSDGISTAQVSSKQIGYTYLNKSKSKKIVISKENSIFAIEGKYPGWDDFKKEGINIIENFKQVLDLSLITRVSIRFINKLILTNSNRPEDYFNTLITAREGTTENSVNSYYIKYTTHKPNSKIRTNVIQSLEENKEDKYSFVFDIDVLCHNNIEYSDLKLDEKLEEIRDIKNSIFFKNLTKKTFEEL